MKGTGLCLCSWGKLTFLFCCFQCFSVQSTKFRGVVQPSNLEFRAGRPASGSHLCRPVCGYTVLFWAFLLKTSTSLSRSSIKFSLKERALNSAHIQTFRGRKKYKKKKLLNYLDLWIFLYTFWGTYTFKCICYMCTYAACVHTLHITLTSKCYIY